MQIISVQLKFESENSRGENQIGKQHYFQEWVNMQQLEGKKKRCGLSLGLFDMSPSLNYFTLFEKVKDKQLYFKLYKKK